MSSLRNWVFVAFKWKPIISALQCTNRNHCLSQYFFLHDNHRNFLFSLHLGQVRLSAILPFLRNLKVNDQFDTSYCSENRKDFKRKINLLVIMGCEFINHTVPCFAPRLEARHLTLTGIISAFAPMGAPLLVGEAILSLNRSRPVQTRKYCLPFAFCESDSD